MTEFQHFGALMDNCVRNKKSKVQECVHQNTSNYSQGAFRYETSNPRIYFLTCTSSGSWKLDGLENW